MPRRREVPKRRIQPDPVYHDRMVAKFVSAMMVGGKKSTAERVFYGAMQIAEKRAGEEALKVFKRALENVKPVLEVKARRVGGATYQVPVEIRPNRRTALGMRWLISYARSRGEKTMTEKLAAEFVDAASNRGNSIKKREDTHKMAEANKAFAHFRF